MINDNIKMTGVLSIILNGKTEEEKIVNNMVVKVGKEFVASRIIGTSEPVMSHMAIGTNNTATVALDSALKAEVGRVALTSTILSERTMVYTALFEPGVGTGAIKEAGIFNDSTEGIMFSRAAFSTVNKAAEDSLTISWAITVN